MKRFRVISLWVLGGLAGLFVASWIGLKLYVSGPGRSAVASQLTEAIGLPVEIESLDVGVGASTVALRIPDPGADPADSILRIGSITTDVSLAGLASGKSSPTRLTVKDVDILLRIDEKGQLLTPLPNPKSVGGSPSGPLPTVELSATRIRIRQTGRPEFVLSGVSGELKREGDGYSITGTVDDPQWGKWLVSGKLASNPADGQVTLSTDRGQLKESLIRTIPYVPSEVWDNLKPTGETPATVSFTFKPGADLGYAVEVRPEATASVTIPTADVTLNKVRGTIRIADGQVSVTDGRVEIADGKINLNGTYRFDQPTTVVTVKVNADELDVRKLPTAWGLPKEIEGRLQGDANLELHITPEGKLETRGSGNGVVKGAKLAGLNAEIALRLVARDGRYQFDSANTAEVK